MTSYLSCGDTIQKQLDFGKTLKLIQFLVIQCHIRAITHCLNTITMILSTYLVIQLMDFSKYLVLTLNSFEILSKVKYE